MKFLLDTHSFISHQLLVNDITLLDLTLRQATHVAILPFHHRDPFDRVLIAQSVVDSIPLISVDDIFDQYGIERVW